MNVALFWILVVLALIAAQAGKINFEIIFCTLLIMTFIAIGIQIIIDEFKKQK